VALAECCIAGGLGARVAFEGPLFAEGPGAFVVSAAHEALARFGAAARVIGEVAGDRLVIDGELDVPVAELARVHRDGLAALLD
jgi:phosphoribosylformylglycinamidine (FGAM) synthase-like enzyme